MRRAGTGVVRVEHTVPVFPLKGPTPARSPVSIVGATLAVARRREIRDIAAISGEFGRIPFSPEITAVLDPDSLRDSAPPAQFRTPNSELRISPFLPGEESVIIPLL